MAYRFQLMHGAHQEQVGTDATGNPIIKRFSQGQEFTSDKPLDEMLGRDKFRRIFDISEDEEESSLRQRLAQLEAKRQQRDAVQSAAEAGFNDTGYPKVANVAVAEPPRDESLEKMSVSELRKFAEGEEIDLGSAKTKTEIITVILDFFKG